MKEAPCMNCKTRLVGCHSICVDYGNFKAMVEKRKAPTKKWKMLNEVERDRTTKIERKMRNRTSYR